MVSKVTKKRTKPKIVRNESWIPKKREILIRKLIVQIEKDNSTNFLLDMLDAVINNYEIELGNYLVTQLQRERMLIFRAKSINPTLEQWVKNTLDDWGICNNK